MLNFFQNILGNLSQNCVVDTNYPGLQSRAQALSMVHVKEFRK